MKLFYHVVLGGIVVAGALSSKARAEGEESLDSASAEAPLATEQTVDTSAGVETSPAKTATKPAEPTSTSEKPSQAPAQALPEIPPGAIVSGGERIDIDGKGFSIAPPSGWTVQRNLPRTSLFLQARVPGAEYPRNIAVVRFSEPKLINETTASEFAEKLVKLYPSVSTTIENYALRNHQSIQMADGREGILFYTDFTGSGRKMMQAHVLLSSQTNHYLVTFTDVAEHFENPDDAGGFLATAWEAMTSIQLDSPNPSPEAGMTYTLAVLVGVSVLISAFALIRRYQAGQKYKEFGNMSVEEGAELYPMSEPAQSTGMVSDVAPITDKIVYTPTSSRVSGITDGKVVKFSGITEKTDGTATQDLSGLEFTEDAVSKKYRRGA